MSDPKQARILLEAAERDASALRGMGNAAVFADEVFGFHVQQAAEKLFKAWLATLGETYPLSHDLATLLDLLNACGMDVARFGEMVKYTRYAVRLRYVAADPGMDPVDREDAVRRVEALLEEVRRRLTIEEEPGAEGA